MSSGLTRRELLTRSLGAAAGVAAAFSMRGPGGMGPAHAQDDVRATWKKAVTYGMLPGDLAPKAKFELAKRVGFDGVECPPMGEGEAAELRGVAEEAGVRIHSVIYGGWGAPLGSADAEVAKKGIAEVEGALRAAKAFGADNILLVPAVVNAGCSYKTAYEESQKNIRTLIPLAEELGIVIAVENVWNNFLLSPVEFARYVDEFESDYVRAYVDLGNMVKFAWSEHWVEALADRIAKIHLKDFKRDGNKFVMLREGDIDWPLVAEWLVKVGYEGWFTCELGGGDEAYLTDVAARVDAIFAGE